MLLFIVTNITGAKVGEIIKDILTVVFMFCTLLIVRIWEDFVLYPKTSWVHKIKENIKKKCIINLCQSVACIILGVAGHIIKLRVR